MYGVKDLPSIKVLSIIWGNKADRSSKYREKRLSNRTTSFFVILFPANRPLAHFYNGKIRDIEFSEGFLYFLLYLLYNNIQSG